MEFRRVLFQSGTAVPHRRGIVITQVVAEDPEAELGRLDEALGQMRDALDLMLARSEVARGGEHREVLETYRMFADDRGWMRRMPDAVRGEIGRASCRDRGCN